MRRKVKEPLCGTGVLSLGARNWDVAYSFTDGAPPTAAPRGARGSLVLNPEDAREAFRACEGRLKLENGATCRVTFTGHQEGSGTAYFEAFR